MSEAAPLGHVFTSAEPAESSTRSSRAGTPIIAPRDIAVGPDGVIWVADTGANAILSVNNGVLGTVVPPGLVSGPRGISVGPFGSVYFTLPDGLLGSFKPGFPTLNLNRPWGTGDLGDLAQGSGESIVGPGGTGASGPAVLGVSRGEVGVSIGSTQAVSSLSGHQHVAERGGVRWVANGTGSLVNGFKNNA